MLDPALINNGLPFIAIDYKTFKKRSSLKVDSTNNSSIVKTAGNSDIKPLTITDFNKP